jgi:hypothetical protein
VRRPGLLTAGMLLGAVGAALAPAGPTALVPFKDLAASAASDIYVAVVIDFGSGSNIKAVEQCVPVAANGTDADALSVDNTVGYNDTGLVCSIDGYPANGVQNCTRSKGSEYYFWSYWHGSSGSWSYAENGPASQTVSPGDVEGWMYQNPGPANPTAPPPGPAPDYAQICGSPNTTTTVSTTTTTPTSASTSTPSTPPRTSTTPTSTGSPSHSSTPTTSPSSSKPTGSTTGAGGAGSKGTSGAKGSTTTTTAPSLGSSSAHSSTGWIHHFSEKFIIRSNHGSGGAPVLPIVLVGLIIAALAVGAVVLWRRRPAEE